MNKETKARKKKRGVNRQAHNCTRLYASTLKIAGAKVNTTARWETFRDTDKMHSVLLVHSRVQFHSEAVQQRTGARKLMHTLYNVAALSSGWNSLGFFFFFSHTHTNIPERGVRQSHTMATSRWCTCRKAGRNVQAYFRQVGSRNRQTSSSPGSTVKKKKYIGCLRPTFHEWLVVACQYIGFGMRTAARWTRNLTIFHSVSSHSVSEKGQTVIALQLRDMVMCFPPTPSFGSRMGVFLFLSIHHHRLDAFTFKTACFIHLVRRRTVVYTCLRPCDFFLSIDDASFRGADTTSIMRNLANSSTLNVVTPNSITPYRLTQK